MKEPEVNNIRGPKPDRLEIRESDKPFVDNRDMCGVLCIICSALITYLLCDKSVIIWSNKAQLATVVTALIFFIAFMLFWLTQKIVRTCHIRAKRKADNKVS